MTRWMRDFRLMPIVLIAVGCLFALKSFGVLFNGGYTLGQRLGNGQLVVTTVPTAPVTQLRSPAVPLEMPSAPPAKLSWMQEMFNYPSDVTGTIKTTKPAEKAAMEKADAAKQVPKEPPPGTKDPYSTVVPTEPPPVASAGERALLERLQKRREELDARGRELDLRESLLKAAEKKLEIEQPSGKPAAKGGAEAGGAAGQGRDEAENARFKSVVTIYETMKPKDAAKIFDRLDIKVLIEMASQIKPQRMSEIMAQMTPEAAERLTTELAAKSGADRTLNPMNLPKIDGRTGGG